MIPATTSDAFLLALESHMRRSGQGAHLSATVIELSGEPDAGTLEATAARLARRHPLLNARLRRGVDFIARWHPGGPDPLPIEIHPAGPLEPLLARLLENPRIDIRAPGPNLELHARPLAPGRWALVLLWPHSLFDAIGIDKLIADLDEADDSPRQDWGETTKATGSHGDLWKAAKPMVEEMRSFPTWRIRSLHRHRHPARSPRFEILRFSPEETASIRQRMASTAGELLMLPYFAAIAARATRAVIGLRHAGDEIPVLLSLPVQRTANPARRPLFQNHMVAWSLMLAPGDFGGLGDTTRTLHRKYLDFLRRKLPTAMEALMKLMERCPSRFYLKPASHYLKGEICTLFHSHTGQFAAASTTLFGQSILDGFHVPSVSDPPGLGIFFSERSDRLSCTLSWREGTLSAEELQLLKTTLLADLQGEPAGGAPVMKPASSATS
ncbi:hypothetical protein [Haloferula sp. A504]|uniref:hypothetical protein n=1 Tax=Haloferula sp. A504 TaxID=3373601 RepID=UPI0031BC2CAC|nr:hypothetical protein [Verrucomicrobiaceae bacterium E54]